MSESCHSTGSPPRFGHAASSSTDNVLRIIDPSAMTPTSSTHTTSSEAVRADSFDYGAICKLRIVFHVKE
ncbi:hypothetical protein M422DRAFT_31066 [Sphaerobolus stellatus SS14]|uniref:Uncharacterized protein n=1 Tax=Sphaerobolus stellatus (strain SS14) TaxID=990650 RepID=A0A0C9VMC5_SPHS4|nr:hypothetical protein M422DRAFT_32809 [Sphaerobolus stellatus SS14]KIJ42947.1 hypothetical protein M422DRAFT_31066 [Sphaerobolus stellatus SS14]